MFADAKNAKAKMLYYLLFDKNYQCAVTEYSGEGVVGVADIFGFTKAGFTHEIEIKVSKSDLIGELNSINMLITRDLLNDQDFTYKGCTKLDKHCKYLDSAPPGEMPWGHREWNNTMVPSRFSFLVTEDLIKIAKNALKETDYGLYGINSRVAGLHPHYSISEIKRPKQLHKNKVTEKIKEYLLRKSSSEIQILREKDAIGVRCTSCNELLHSRCLKCEVKMSDDKKYKKCMKDREKEGMGFMDSHKVCSENK